LLIKADGAVSAQNYTLAVINFRKLVGFQSSFNFAKELILLRKHLE